jgi:O-antigen chain-terminating methyltransferase
MATLKGFRRWLRSLRALNAQRDALERQAADLGNLRVQYDAQRETFELRERELREWAVQLRALQARVAEESEQERQVRDGVRLEITGLTSRLDSAARSAAVLGRSILGLETTTDSLHARLQAIAPPFPALPELASEDGAAWFHAAVEAKFRGPTEDIRERLRVYVPYLATLPAAALKLQALDLGCGRGEWLELLRGERISAVGIDANPVSIERCLASGLHALRGDALEYLRQQPGGEISLVTAFHLVEHLATETVMALLFEARRVLAPGGLLILETPNPENLLVASCSFHLDPTHRRPIPMPLLRMFVEFAKLEVVETVALQPDDEMRRASANENWPPTLTRLLGGPRDAGIIARKPLASPSTP